MYGIGSIFASLVLWVKETGPAVQIVRGLMMVLCGITFPVAITPLWMQNISKWIPFTYGIAAARQIMITGDGLLEASRNIIICLIEGIILMILGRIAFSYTEKKVKNEGALGRY